MKTLVLGTGNAGKIGELMELLKDLGVEVKSLAEFKEVEEPIESGSTFRENAELKARHYARSLNFNVLADDSGLEVDAIDGRPGVYSSRFAGENATDYENNAKLLKELEGVKSSSRTAKFVCQMALADAEGKILFCAGGSCHGLIAPKPFGNNGFGYDPLFIPEGYDKTFGELPENVKKSLSHRGKAAQKIAHFLGFNSGLLT